jgi:calcineurin-like phosphoesterase family protein
MQTTTVATTTTPVLAEVVEVVEEEEVIPKLEEPLLLHHHLQYLQCAIQKAIGTTETEFWRVKPKMEEEIKKRSSRGSLGQCVHRNCAQRAKTCIK